MPPYRTIPSNEEPSIIGSNRYSPPRVPVSLLGTSGRYIVLNLRSESVIAIIYALISSIDSADFLILWKSHSTVMSH
jgi:hypothetical protein